MAPKGRAAVNLMAQGQRMTNWQADLVSEQLELGECQSLPRAINGYAPCLE
jgi:hypothetical protein